jgi:hypothetical protein
VLPIPARSGALTRERESRNIDPSMIHEAFPYLTETASGSHPCCVVSVTYDRTSYFHGGDLTNLGISCPTRPLTSNDCVKTVLKPLPFGALELCLSEKQIPQVVVLIRSRQNEESV